MKFKHLHPDTPIESYYAGKVKVDVKRDDLYSSYPAPPLAKLRGVSVLLSNLKEQGVQTVAVIDTKIGKAGQGIAYLCSELGMECVSGFPLIKRQIPEEPKLVAKELGATLYPLVAGRFGLCVNRFTKYVTSKGWYMLPSGLTCKETVDALTTEAMKVASEYKTIVVCTGTGTIATGIALGAPNCQVYGVSCGMSITAQKRRINQLSYPNLLSNLILVPSRYTYYDRVYNCPFPSSPNYDIKAWEWLVENAESLASPILFWNIGV